MFGSFSVITWTAAACADLLFGEPPTRLHPVVAMGRAIEWIERRAPSSPRAQLAYGPLLVLLPAFGASLAGVFVERTRPRGLRAVLVVALLKSTFALRELLRAAQRVESVLAIGDLARARDELPALVSRPVAALDRGQIASAVVESLAENLSDSYVAPLVWYAVGGLPAALAYRAVNTADAMVGYHGRYEHLGKSAARTDDLANAVPARITALAIAAVAPFTGADPRGALAVLARDRGRTESPNAGWPMSACAGALGVTLAKPEHYRLGTGRAPEHADIARARRLVMAAAVLATCAIALARSMRRD